MRWQCGLEREWRCWQNAQGYSRQNLKWRIDIENPSPVAGNVRQKERLLSQSRRRDMHADRGIDSAIGSLAEFYDAIEASADLQRTVWWAGQPDIDKALELILIVQNPFEIATAALICLKLHFLPGARDSLMDFSHELLNLDDLVVFGRGGRRGSHRLANILASSLSQGMLEQPVKVWPSDLLAAVFTLYHYQDRLRPNPLLCLEWTKEGLDLLQQVSSEVWPTPETKPYLWRNKLKAIKGFLGLLQSLGGYSPEAAACLDDDTLRRRLLEIAGIGDETADTISISFFERTQAVADKYFWTLAKNHGWLHRETKENYAVGRRLILEAIDLIVSRRAEQTSTSVAHHLHVWIDEVCKKWCNGTPPACGDCPLKESPISGLS